MLTEYKDDTRHYFEDDQGRKQGEAKWLWHSDGKLHSHKFYVNDEVYRDLIENPVDEKDKFIISLETGGKWIKE